MNLAEAKDAVGRREFGAAVVIPDGFGERLGQASGGASVQIVALPGSTEATARTAGPTGPR